MAQDSSDLGDPQGMPETCDHYARGDYGAGQFAYGRQDSGRGRTEEEKLSPEPNNSVQLPGLVRLCFIISGICGLFLIVGYFQTWGRVDLGGYGSFSYTARQTQGIINLYLGSLAIAYSLVGNDLSGLRGARWRGAPMLVAAVASFWAADHGWQGFTANLGDVDGRLFSVEMGTGLILVLSASAAMIVCGVVVLISDRNMKPVEQDKGVLSPQGGYSAPDDSGEQSLDFSDLNFDDSSREE